MAASLFTAAFVSAADYRPRFWVEGALDSAPVGAELRDTVAALARQGWDGVTTWGADRRGATMEYYFTSPFLARQDWAVAQRDRLTPLVAAAHTAGLKVMLNVEDVNPDHWKQHHWTPAAITAVAGDLADSGVDAVFEECFETKPALFTALAGELARRGVRYVSGTDPMLLREPHFTPLWPQTGAVNIYHYYLKRDKLFTVATLAQHGSLGYGWAKFWGKPTALTAPLDRDWGIAPEDAPAVVSYLCLIRALQFRVDDFVIFGGQKGFDPARERAWIDGLVARQERDRPLLNIVVLLRPHDDAEGWNRLFNSGDAITSGAFNAGYDVVVSDRVLPAAAHWIYAPSGAAAALPPDVVALFAKKQPVFLQCADAIPSGHELDAGWKAALAGCGVNAAALSPADQTDELPFTGYYRDIYLRFPGSDIQRGKDLRAGTVIPPAAIDGKIHVAPNRTYGRGPFLVSRENKHLVTATCLNWEAAYPISHLLSGGGVLPSSNVWGLVGKKITALLAIETTALELTIPGLADGTDVRVTVWDRKHQKKSEETLTYRAPFRRALSEYDLILIEAR